MKSGTDLLNVMGKNPNAPIRHGQSAPQATPVPSRQDMPTAIDSIPGNEANDLLARSPAASEVSDDLGGVSPTPNGVADTTLTSNKSTAVSTPVEPVGGKNDDWTKDSLMAELRKTREEAKRTRLEKQDSIDRLKKEYEKRLEEIKASAQPLEDQARELAELKAKEADKNKTLAEKLADREARLIEKESELRRVREGSERELFSIKAELENYRSEINVQNQFYQDKLNEELNDIPERFKVLASRLIKGCDSVREQVEVLREAKDQGLFKEKTTIVSHATPDVTEGARLSSASIKNEENQNRKKMSSTDKIGAALKNLNSNPVYRGK